ncbi:hypothetical protein ACFFX0_10805 [Citricoccus parietis]|uniref:Uncharacterized protein n=1 Tax=Citricoccus parietis TaxID=592307 RepID=A0ABV5FYA7_9MICC
MPPGQAPPRLTSYRAHAPRLVPVLSGQPGRAYRCTPAHPIRFHPSCASYGGRSPKGNVSAHCTAPHAD